MLKQIAIGTSVVALAGGLIFGRDSVSYLSTAVSSVRESIKQEVPLEFEVQRARELVTHVDGEIRKCLHVIAEEEVNVAELRRELDVQLAGHDRQREQILTQRSDLAQKKETYNYGGRIYTVSEVERDLNDRFSRYQTVEETIKNRRQVLLARERSLSAARQKLDTMLDSKEQLLVEIENLDARVKMLQASEAASTVVTIDDSQLARTRQLISKLNRQIDVRQKLADGAGQVSGLIPIDAPEETQSDVTARIDQYFGTEDTTRPAVATPASNTAAL